MMKEDKTQSGGCESHGTRGCGLMMKEDKTQSFVKVPPYERGCGLMMKEDKTQSPERANGRRIVVV